MSKRSGKSNKKSFSVDLESLLISDESQDGQNDNKISEIESVPQTKKPKVSKTGSINKSKGTTNAKNDTSPKSDDENENPNVVSQFFESVGNDFNKSMAVKKSRLEQFTEDVISLYYGKIGQLIKKQEEEVDNFKKETVTQIQEELDKFEEELKKLKLLESKLMKILEQQMKLIQKTSAAESEWIEKFSNLHKNFVQDYEQLKNKHKNEIMDLKKVLTTDVSSLQNKCLTEAKKEEMTAIKK